MYATAMPQLARGLDDSHKLVRQPAPAPLGRRRCFPLTTAAAYPPLTARLRLLDALPPPPLPDALDRPPALAL